MAIPHLPPMVSPVLVGRDDLLELADRRLAEVRSGRGEVLLLAGEAGIGKTRLLGAVERRASLAGMTVVHAAAFPRDLEVAGAIFLELAHALAGTGPLADTGRKVRRLLEGSDADLATGDRHRKRRLLVLDLVDLVVSLSEGRSLVVSLEDLHWADDLSLEVLGQLARRIAGSAVAVVGTYRSDELYPRIPMREWRARLLTQRLAEEVRLTRLDARETATMVRAVLRDAGSASHDLLADLHRRSDGIPLHVEELVGAMLGGGAASGELLVPDTLADAISSRTAQLSTRARRLARAAAIIGRTFDAELLTGIVSDEPAAVDRALVELQDRFFIVPGRAPGSYDFRHALIRDALYAQVGPSARRRAHARVASLLVQRGADEAALSAHFELAGLQDEAHHWSVRAAERSRRLSSHREAAELYRRALRTQSRDVRPAARARLLVDFAAEAAASDDNAAAVDAYAEARDLLLGNGQPAAAAELVPAMVAARHLLGAPLEERVALLERGLEELRASGREDERLHARLLAGLSAAYMLDRRLDESIEHGERARAIARQASDPSTDLNAVVTLGSDFVFAGRMDEGWELLEGAIATARDGGLEAEAARAYRMIGTSASVLVEYDRAEAWLGAGIEYAERVELWNHRHYMAAHLAHVAWATGDWPRAEALARDALADGRGGITTRITALHVLGYVAMGRGDPAVAERHLGEAREVGERMGELQRLSPAIWGLAETALVSGRTALALELCEAGHRASAKVADAAYLYPYLVTGTRALLELQRPADADGWIDEVAALLRRRAIPGTLHAIPHAEGLTLLARGSTRRARELLGTARSGWSAARRRWDECWAMLDLARAEQRSHRRREATAMANEALKHATDLGAEPLRARAEDLLRGLRGRGDDGEAWSPLTAREFEVAGLIAEGRTNTEIAEELGISPKTVSAHVEHILDRLAATRRAEIAAWVGSREPADRAT
ncbi:MAG TPA: AAA family ATPase [Candidatus Limnocylindrales bacterium]|nr:AAA family ATPase [Candidatus Limnocylindrales bacterium]